MERARASAAPEQLRALEEPGRDLRPGHGDANRLKRLTRLQLEPFGEAAQRRLDRFGRERLGLGERLAGRIEHAGIEERGVWLDLLEQKPDVAGELGQRLDLLLDERRRPADEGLVPVDTLLPEGREG